MNIFGYDTEDPIAELRETIASQQDIIREMQVQIQALKDLLSQSKELSHKQDKLLLSFSERIDDAEVEIDHLQDKLQTYANSSLNLENSISENYAHFVQHRDQCNSNTMLETVKNYTSEHCILRPQLPPLFIGSQWDHHSYLESYKKNAGNQCEIKGPYSLVAAINDNSVELLEFLLKLGISPNCKLDNYYSPLSKAAREGKIEIIDLLVKYGANLEFRDSQYGRTPLYEAFMSYKVNSVAKLCMLGADRYTKQNHGISMEGLYPDIRGEMAIRLEDCVLYKSYHKNLSKALIGENGENSDI